MSTATTIEIHLPAEEMTYTLPARIKKRYGGEEDFHPEKVKAAVRRCFLNGLKRSPAEAEALAEDISRRVLNVLAHSSDL